VSGRVVLVGGGPGDPGLLTLRAAEALGEADVVLFDRLAPAEALAHAREGAELVDVGKIGGGPQVPQEETTALLVRRAAEGNVVVRLKGGDPFVFGRGGEEAQACAAAGIPFEVVPGVTAGVAAPAWAGIPVTHRGLAGGVAFVTGFTQCSELDWDALARFPGTLVFYMGVRTLPQIAERLVAGGRPADEPAAVVQEGTLPGQRVVQAPLRELPARVSEAGLRAPAVTVVGPVAALRSELAWVERRPLHGRTVVVTRARAQASALARGLRALGAEVVEAPAIRIEPLPASVPDAAGFDLLCVTSPNGAERLLEEVRDARALAGPRIAAIGPGTARALRAGGIEPDVVPPRAVAESLVEALAGLPVRRALIARAEEARPVLEDALRARGAEVVVLPLYRTVHEPLAEVPAADYVTFASASAARAYQAAGGDLRTPRLASIGPVTTAALRELGVEPHVEAAEHTPDGLVAALVADATGSPR
jgi:uroporphyrinogen III methyltransferase / synthase